MAVNIGNKLPEGWQRYQEMGRSRGGQSSVASWGGAAAANLQGVTESNGGLCQDGSAVWRVVILNHDP